MSKHAIDDNIQGDLWKKMKYGAATAVAVGSGIYAITSALKNKGFSNMVDEVKTAMHTAPLLVAGTTPKFTLQSEDETREVLNMQLRFAMEQQDMHRVQEISRKLDELQGVNVTTSATTQAQR